MFILNKLQKVLWSKFRLRSHRLLNFLASEDFSSWLIFGVTAFFLAHLAACQKFDLSQSVIRVTPVSPLLVEDGKEVNWKFKAEVGLRSVKIMSIIEDRLPLGVTISVKNGEWIVSGKALRSRNSDGHLQVKAFDEDGCKQTLRDGLGFFDRILARFGLKVKGENSLCSYQLHQDDSPFVKSGLFAWHSAQFSDIVSQPIKPSFEELAKKSLASTEPTKKNENKDLTTRVKSKSFIISPLEAPHHGLSFLDHCFVYEYGHCGLKSDCAWHAGSCASISQHNLKLVGK
jgi:hypothetical protein